MPDASRGRLGCARHAAMVGGLLLVALAVVLARNWEGAARLAQDARAMGEGAEEARALQTPDDLLAWVRAHPDRASLVVWDVAADSAVLALQPDVPRPAAGLPALLLTAELARQSAAALDTSRTVPASALRPLPGVERARRDTAAVSLAALARRALGSDRAAADVLLAVLGREAVEAAPERFGVGELEAPLPLGGLLLAWASAGLTTGRGADRPADRAALRDAAFEQARAFAAGEAGPAERALARTGLTHAEQQEVAGLAFPRGTAAGYARLLAHAADSRLGTPEVSRTLLALVTRPSGGALRLGIVGGGFPGHVGTAGVLASAEGGRVAVLLVQDVPTAVLARLSETGLDASLLIHLLMVSRGNSGDPLGIS